MNKKRVCYLCGPMEAVTEADATNWRDRVTPKLKEIFSDIEIIDPCKTEASKLKGILPDDIKVDDVKAKLKGWKQSGCWEKFDAAIKAIIKADLDAVDASDFILVFLDFKVVMGGTISELTTAYKHRVPIYAVTYDNISDSNSWIVGMCRLGGKIYPNFNQALEAIEADFKKKGDK